MHKRLYAMVGLPRSGKSTHAISMGIPIVNPDSIRLAIHGRPYVPSAEPYVWAITKTMVKSLFIAGHNEVVIDATNTTRKRREAWISDDWSTKFMLVECPVELCLQRADKHPTHSDEDKEGLKQAIIRMHEDWEDLDTSEDVFIFPQIGE